MNNDAYRPCIIDSAIKQHLRAFGAICIEGPEWCGKTWSALRYSQSAFFVGDPERNFQNRQLAQIDPSIVLQGKHPRLIDEWQEVPSLWDAVRITVDQSTSKGQFILTVDTGANGIGRPLMMGDETIGMGELNRFKREVL